MYGHWDFYSFGQYFPSTFSLGWLTSKVCISSFNCSDVSDCKKVSRALRTCDVPCVVVVMKTCVLRMFRLTTS